MIRRLVRAAVVTVVALAGPGRSVADPPMATLEYAHDASAVGCPDEQAIRDGVAAHLGRDPFQDHADVRVVAKITAVPRGLRATITFAADSPSANVRELSAATDQCPQLGVALELTIAIALDPRAGITPLAPAPAVAAPTGTVEAKRSQADPRPETVVVAAPALGASSVSIESQGHTNLSGRVATMIGFGATPGISIGLAVGAEARRGRWSVALEGRAEHGNGEAVAVGRITGDLVSGTIAPCVHRDHLAGCAVFAAGELRAAGHDLMNAHSVAAPYVGAGGRLAWSSSFGPLLLVAEIDLVVPLVRTQLSVGTDEVWSTAPVAAILGLGIARSFL